jgi:hypothetical protein
MMGSRWIWVARALAPRRGLVLVGLLEQLAAMGRHLLRGGSR